MKKYLMTVMAAVTLGGLFVGCSNDADLSGGNTAEFNIVQNYEKAFVTRFGQPAANQNWGFGASVNTRGHNANANEWADPDKAYGGWTVPDPLEDGQKLRVQKYFQYNQDPGGTQCDYTNFFVQQVYKGNPQTKGPYSDEQYQSANNGWVVGSNHMDHLTAGSIHDHINNFNYGDYSGGGTVTVLDNGQHVNGGTTHQDQIMLMVNSQTDCFGYWNSDGSLGHDDRYRLVSAQTIDDWIDSHADLGFGPSYGKKVVDDWDRHFIGFDFDQVVGYDVLAHTDEDVLGADGNPVQVVNKNGQSVNKKENKYAKITDFPGLNNMPYVWYGGKLMKIGTAPAGSRTGEVDIIDDFTYTWNDAETFDRHSDHSVTFNCKTWGGFATSTMRDWSQFEKLVVEFESTTIGTQIKILGNGNRSYSSYIEAGPARTKVEFNIAGSDISDATQIAFQTDGEGTIEIKRIYLTYLEYFDNNVLFPGVDVPILINETNQYCGLNWSVSSDDGITHNYVYYDQNAAKHSDGKALDLDLLKSKYDDKYLPVDTKGLREWVKVQGGADGYYSDWIVTICKANGGSTPPPPVGFICRVIAEDLTVGENTDFDFNDVVFDVYSNGVIRIRACGGTLPLRVDGREVHGLFGKEIGEMINTGWNGSIDYENTYRDIEYSGGPIADAAAANGILVEVQKQGQWWPLDAPVGEVASKIAVDNDYPWCREREDIDSKWHLSNTGFKPFSEFVQGRIIGNEWYQMVIREVAKYQNKKNNP